MKKVFATTVGAVIPNFIYDSHNYQHISPYKGNQPHIISSDVIHNFPYDGKGMMSQQTKLMMKSMELALSSASQSISSVNQTAQIFVGNGPISLETRTIRLLINFLTDVEDNKLNYEKLSENIEKLPPLDGIKMLSTAPTHFYAKEAGCNGPGQPIFNGNASGLTALCLAFEAIAYGSTDLAIVASGDAPLVDHTTSYLSKLSKEEFTQFIESAITFVLKSENCLSAEDKIIFEVVNSVISTLPINWTQEDLDKHQKPLKDMGGDGLNVVSSSAAYNSNRNNGFITTEKIGLGASTSLFDILIGLKTSQNLSENQFIVTGSSNFGMSLQHSLKGTKMVQIAITGIGIVSPLGNTYDEVVESFKTNKSGISLSEDETSHKIPTHHAAYVKNFNSSLDSDSPFKTRFAQFAIQASLDAILDSAISDSDFDCSRKALIIGSEPAAIDLKREMFSLRGIYSDLGLDKSDVTECGLFPETILSEICALTQIRGRSYFHLGTCSAAAQAIGEGKRLIEYGLADMVLCGGASSRVDPLSMLRLIRVGALAPTSNSNAASLSMPFDRKRQGFTMGEGAVMFVIESLESAKNRNKIPHALLSGYGAALDGYSITDPHPEELGMKFSMKRAIQDAGVSSGQIGYINAHGTSTQKNDYHETRAIRDIFKGHVNSLSVSSTKSSHGHLMSAAGAIELLASIIAIKEGFIPPTLNLLDPDPECDLDFTPNNGVIKSVDFALSNSFGLGGQNASLIVKRF